jgi:hypothetical protein
MTTLFRRERRERAPAAAEHAVDRNELREGEAILYTYGPIGDALFVVVRHYLDGFDVRADAYAIKRYGRPNRDAREERVALA